MSWAPRLAALVLLASGFAGLPQGGAPDGGAQDPAKAAAAVRARLEALGEPKDEASIRRRDRLRAWLGLFDRILERRRRAPEFDEAALAARAEAAARPKALPARRTRLPADFDRRAPGGFWLDTERRQLESLAAKLKAELADVEQRERAGRAALAELDKRLAAAKARTEAVLAAERKQIEQELERWQAFAAKEGEGAPPPEDKPILAGLIAGLQEELRLLAREREAKAKLREVLAAERAAQERWLERLRKERLEPLRRDLAAVEAKLAEVQRRLLPPVPDLESLLGPAVAPEVRRRLSEVFAERRARIADEIRALSARVAERRALEGRKAEEEAALERAETAVKERLETTEASKQTSQEVLFYKLRKARTETARELEAVRRDPSWRLAQRVEELRVLLAGAARRRAEVEESFARELRAALAGAPEPPALAGPRKTWVDLERRQVERLVLETERATTLAYEVLALLERRRSVLEGGLKELARRGLFLRDPDRLRGLLALPELLAREGEALAAALRALPGPAFGLGAGRAGLSPLRRAFVWLLPLLGLALALLGRRLAARLLARIEGEERPPRRLVHYVALCGFLRRAAFPAGLGGGLLAAAGSGTLPPEQRVPLAGLGVLLLAGGAWWAALRIALRPLRPRLRLLPLSDREAARLHLYLLVGLLFWLAGQAGAVLEGLLPGARGRAAGEGLTALREGGLLLVFLLVLGRRRLFTELFSAGQDGGFAFLANFFRLVLWPARLVLVAALAAWAFSYHGIAVLLGDGVAALLGGVTLAAVFHEVVVEELRFRFRSVRGAREEAGEGGAARLTLFGEYLEIVETLATILVACLGASWIFGFDSTDWRDFAGLRLWGTDRELVTVGDLGACLLGLYLTGALARRTRRTVEALLSGQTGNDRGLRYTLGTMTSYVVVLVGGLIALSFVRVGLSQIQWMLAALGVGIGFGLQDIVSNFFSGLILLFERPLKVGDVVKVGDTLGEVKKITIRSTTVTSFDNIDVIVPNKDFISQAITNWTGTDRDMRSTIEVGVAYGSDLKKVRKVLLDTVKAHGRVYKRPEPAVFIKGFGASSIDFAVVYWTSIDWKRSTYSDLHFAIHAALAREGIEIPFPQLDLHVKEAPGGEPAEAAREVRRAEPPAQVRAASAARGSDPEEA